MKNELWDITAGMRSRRGYCLFFNPTRPDSARFNPLFEIRKGDNEVRDAQNIVEMLVNPTGAKHTMDIWDQQASQFLVALILHVLYAEPDQFKNLATVRARLLDFKRTAVAMITHAAPIQSADGCAGSSPGSGAGCQRIAPPAGEVSVQRDRHGGQLSHALGGRHHCPQHRDQ